MTTDSVIFFLGAGASRAFGYPLTNDILPLVNDCLRDGRLFPDRNVVPPIRGEHRRALNSSGFLPNAMGVLVDDLTELLPGALDAAALRPPLGVTPLSVTDLLSLIDHMIVNQSSPLRRYSVDKLVRLRGLVQRAIATVVSQPMDTDIAATEQHRLARFINWLVARRGQGLVVVTTNYDLAIERPLAEGLGLANVPPVGPRIDYGCSWRQAFTEDATGQDVVQRRPDPADIAFFKLHGSISWLHCDLCDHVYINPTVSIFEGAYSSRFREESSCACGHWPLSPLLVAPSMVREVRDPSLLSIWQATLEALRRASRWIVVGYGLPPEDLAIRSMLIRAFRTAAREPRIEVYEKGLQPTVELRYRVLFGPAVQVFPGGMAQMIDSLPP